MSTWRHLAVAVLSLAAFGLYGCSLVTTTLNESDAGSIQILDVGDVLLVQLKGNTTTGYEWARTGPASLEDSPLDVITEGEYQTLGCEPVGSPGRYVFRYRAMRLGTVVLEFEYRQPWDVDNSVDSYALTVWIR